MKKRRLCIIVHPPVALSLLRRQWIYWQEQGFDVHCISGPSPEEHERVRNMGVTTHVIHMERYPSPLKDFISLVRIWWTLMRNRFDIIHVSVTKASLLGSLGAFLSGHRRIYYLVRGRTYENMTGLQRKMMNTCEKVVCRLATVVVPICKELGEVLVKEGLCSEKKIRTVGSGSSAGIDLDRYTRTEKWTADGREIRKEFGIADDELVILFVGWLRRDKGVNELVKAFACLAQRHVKLRLLLLGNFEPKDPLEEDVVKAIDEHEHIHHLKWRLEPVPVYSAADIVAFPSYREGFGNVPMEAAAMELPVVASDIMGCREAVVRDETALLVPVADSEALEAGLERLVKDPELRQRLAANGRRRVVNEFRQELVWDGTRDIMLELMGEKKA